MRIEWKRLLVALAIPLGVGGLAALLSGGMGDYRAMNQPPLSPPGWVFPVVWSILYLMMGYSSYLIWVSDAPKEQIRKTMLLYAAQLVANFIWPLLFFGGKMYLTALVWIIVLWIVIFLTIRAFGKIRELAGDLLIPYILWVTFAAYLNFGIFLLN